MLIILCISSYLPIVVNSFPDTHIRLTGRSLFQGVENSHIHPSHGGPRFPGFHSRGSEGNALSLTEEWLAARP